MEAVGQKAYAEVASSLPRHINLQPVRPNGQSLTKYPHLGFTKFGSFDVKNDDGTKTTINLYAANFRANPIYENGKQVFERIPDQFDGVQNGAMLYAHALDNNGNPDRRWGDNPNMPGVAFRLRDVKMVAEACTALVGSAPTAQRQQNINQSMAPRPSMAARGLAYA